MRAINTTLLTDCALDKSLSSYLISRPTLPFSGSAMCLLSAAASHFKMSNHRWAKICLVSGVDYWSPILQIIAGNKGSCHGDCFLSRDLVVNLDHDKNPLNKHP
jgi:hypothetical protein